MRQISQNGLYFPLQDRLRDKEKISINKYEKATIRKQVSCHGVIVALFFVYLEISIANGILLKSSFIITISLASIATSDPAFPIDIPISALFNTGASLTPSPTNILKELLSISSYILYLSVGNISYLISSIPSFLPIASATSFLSPVNK